MTNDATINGRLPSSERDEFQRFIEADEDGQSLSDAVRGLVRTYVWIRKRDTATTLRAVLVRRPSTMPRGAVLPPCERTMDRLAARLEARP